MKSILKTVYKSCEVIGVIADLVFVSRLPAVWLIS